MGGAADLSELRRHVESTKNRTENQCARALRKFAQIMLPAGHRYLYQVACEVCTTRGRCDLVVVADEHVNSKESKRVAYVWELKAPQCCAFLSDGQSRARPSDELYSAENQLLHYTKCLRSNREWQSEKKINAEQDVRLGGIVIGRECTFAGPSANEELTAVARRAREIREEFFYCNRLLLWDWDHVLWAIENLRTTRMEFDGATNLADGTSLTSASAANKPLKLTVGRRRPPAA